MKRNLTFCFFLFSALCFAQQEQNNEKNSQPSSETSKSFVPVQIAGNEKESNSDTVLTPEQQGFTKFVENGKTIYRKENNGVIVEYIPEL